MKNKVVLKKLETEKTLLNTIKARKLNVFATAKMPRLNYEKHPRRQGGGQKITKQASGSVVGQHQGVVRAQHSKVYEISQSVRVLASDF